MKKVVIGFVWKFYNTKPVIFLNSDWTPTDWGNLGLHSKIICKYIGCLVKLAETKHNFFLMEHHVFGHRFGKYGENMLCA